MNEKRLYPRLLLDVLVNYSDYYFAKTKDISMGGINLVTNDELQAGRFISFEFSLPDKEFVRVFGKIEWCKKNAPNLYENGIQFRLLKDASKTKIENFLSTIQFSDDETV
jgi:Tfp pilus assembly protein PilZ